MSRILLVEDNPAYAAAAESVIMSVPGMSMTHANCYAHAAECLAMVGVGRNFGTEYSGAFIDCFFPDTTGGSDLTYGKVAVERMAAADTSQKRNSPVTKALTQVGKIVGVQFLKQVAKNAHVDYRSNVDPYWALEKAMEENPANQPLGILVAENAEQLGIPLVLTTSTFHHDELTQPIQNYAHRKGWTLIDCEHGQEETKASPEYWERAFEALKREIGSSE